MERNLPWQPGASNESEYKMFNCRNVVLVGHGDGTYTVAPQILKLTVPASVYAGNYCTEATISITTGP